MCQVSANTCGNCERMHQEVQTLQQQLQQQQQTLAALAEEIRQLKEKLAAKSKDSSTSSKPPSSDIVKPSKEPATPDSSPRKGGGQPGHPKHTRTAFSPEELTAGSHTHRMTHCPDCQTPVVPAEQLPRIVQQIEIVQPPLEISEHRALPYWCPHCCRVHFASLPGDIELGGLLGPRLTALIAYLKGFCHASYSTIRIYLRDVLKVKVSRSMLMKVISKVSAALDEPYEEILARLPGEATLNVDETGHNDNGDLWWTWCFRASLYTLFKISPRRSGDVLIEVLGKEFNGVLGCDYYSAYRRFMREFDVTVQFCLAHLIRDVKFLTTLPNEQDKAYGTRLRDGLKRLFSVIHDKDNLAPGVFQEKLQAAREAIVHAATTDVPNTRHCQNLAKRFLKHGAAYFEFMTTPGVEPTNNLAEQAIRFVVIDRHITQGTRGEMGRRWCERIWTVIATCTHQGRSVFEYLCDAVKSYFNDKPAPSLVANG
jgi:transposase